MKAIFVKPLPIKYSGNVEINQKYPVGSIVEICVNHYGQTLDGWYLYPKEVEECFREIEVDPEKTTP